LDWDISAPEEEGFRRWISMYVDLAEKYQVELIFIHITSTAESLSSPEFEQKFKAVTGAKLITFDSEIHALLAKDGKRDAGHINKKGRLVFLPWLIERIREKCGLPEGCF
jgi:hypothetical protein